MQKKLTITVDEDVYEGLHKVIGRRKISQFIEDLVRPHVIGSELEAGYAAMAADEVRERDAEEWADVLSEDIADETR
jgi:predicted CopG family antitoxin